MSALCLRGRRLVRARRARKIAPAGHETVRHNPAPGCCSEGLVMSFAERFQTSRAAVRYKTAVVDRRFARTRRIRYTSISLRGGLRRSCHIKSLLL